MATLRSNWIIFFKGLPWLSSSFSMSISFLYLSLLSFTDYTNITQDHKNYSILGNKKEDSNPVLFFIWAAVDISLRSLSTWLRLSLISPADSLLIRLKAPHLAHSFRTKMWFSPYYNNIKRIVTNVTILFIWAAVDSNHRPHPYQCEFKIPLNTIISHYTWIWTIYANWVKHKNIT